MKELFHDEKPTTDIDVHNTFEMWVHQRIFKVPWTAKMNLNKYQTANLWKSSEKTSKSQHNDQEKSHTSKSTDRQERTQKYRRPRKAHSSKNQSHQEKTTRVQGTQKRKQQ